MHKKRKAVGYYLHKGQLVFRLLCDSHAVGGLIGSNGNIIMALERETSSKIHVSVPGPTSNHRVVHIVGSHSLTRCITLDGVESKVSHAQFALIRVFDRILESEAEYEASIGGSSVGDGGRVVKCWILVGPNMVGAVMGKGGTRISRVVREARANVKISPLESVPPGAADSDELVQITGGSLPVKKALVAVSRFLQQKAIELESGVPEATPSLFLDRSMDTRNTQGMNSTSRVAAKVVFKLICPYEAAGFVIGSKGKKLKAIEEETRASIRFCAADVNYHERVATISALENREAQYSVAQNATVRVFNELFPSAGKKPNKVSARLLIPPYQSDWLSGGEVSIMSNLHKENGATLKIMDLDHLPVGAAADEKVLQIEGDYPNVQISLFQVTWTLRERFFEETLPKDILFHLPHKLFSLPSQKNKISRLSDKLSNCSISEEPNGSLPPTFPHTQFSNGSSSTTGPGSSSETATNGDSNDGSVDRSCVVTSVKLEIVVREDVFNAVYGEDGTNLARLRVISGATVEVQDPNLGSDGKVTISGTRDQTLVAQSLLQAFLMSV